MFRKMRRNRQLLGESECVEILTNGRSGVLAVHGDDGYPYAVPLNYIYTDGKLYFHCAGAGHKIDAIRRDNKVSFCVVGMEQTVSERFTTYFKSAVVFGRATIVEDDLEKRYAVEQLAVKYAPQESSEKRDAEINRDWNSLLIVRIDIEHKTGKQAIELVK